MSTPETNNILLPTAEIDIFVKDPDILKAAEDLIDDWRFARVSIHIEEGGVDTAIAAYANSNAPNMIIIETDDIGEEFTARLEDLAAHCDEDTDAIVIGPVNDVGLYRVLIEMGVRDYLVRPLEENMLANVIGKSLIEQIGITGSRMITYCGAKGGVGTSALAQAASWLCTRDLNQKVVLVDLAGGWSTNSVGIGFEPGATLTEAIHAVQDKDEDGITRMLHKADDRFFVLGTGSDGMLEEYIESRHIEELIDFLMARYPVVVVDASGASQDVKKLLMRRSSQINLITNPTLASLRLARVLYQEMRALRGGEEDNIELIVNMTGQSKAYEASKKDIEEALERGISALIPYETKAFMAAENESKSAIDIKVAKEILTKELLPLLHKIIQPPLSKDGGGEKTGFLDKIMTKIKD